MPNRYQLAFLASFVGTFFLLVAIARYINSKLKAAGYYVSDLILIGLPKNHTQSTDSNTTTSTGMVDFTSGVYTQLPALLLAVATCVFVYVKFGKNTAVWQKKACARSFGLERIPIDGEGRRLAEHSDLPLRPPRPDDVLGLPIGQHVSITANFGGKDIMRSYTPTSSDDDLGHFDLLIKSYEKGNISRYVSQLKIGDKVRIKGPKGQFKYHMSLSREFGMIAGGTGITPMLQIIRAALKNHLDRTKISLIYANVNVEDILLKKELDELAANHSHRFKVYFVLNNPPPNWTGGVGFILMCGPPPMITAMKKHLADLDYPAPRTVSKLQDQVFCF
ncbi:NADH-cytochrome b5 reductase 1 [Grifola frondosa]|uniref:NADH-cytochrome b5 reductase n=1 Tax=Grifola frondosa TaxID=5627 RepID=A0A1C7MXS9_GRIFR|nr:NADH-cytochrome b5 reductase 1 [Grifola frondosa]